MSDDFLAPWFAIFYFCGVQAGGGFLGIIGFFFPNVVPSPPVLDGWWYYAGGTKEEAGKFSVKVSPDGGDSELRLVNCPNVRGWYAFASHRTQKLCKSSQSCPQPLQLTSRNQYVIAQVSA
jgi:hypothetical protein